MGNNHSLETNILNAYNSNHLFKGHTNQDDWVGGAPATPAAVGPAAAAAVEREPGPRPELSSLAIGREPGRRPELSSLAIGVVSSSFAYLLPAAPQHPFHVYLYYLLLV